MLFLTFMLLLMKAFIKCDLGKQFFKAAKELLKKKHERKSFKATSTNNT